VVNGRASGERTDLDRAVRGHRAERGQLESFVEVAAVEA
jgi:hypothetical protein